MAATPPPAVPQPPGTGGTADAWAVAIAALPIELRLVLLPLFDPIALRAERSIKLRAALFDLAKVSPGSYNAMAAAVERSLSRYAATAWRFDRESDVPHDKRHELAHRIMRLNDGEVPAARTLRRLFRVGQNS